MRILEYFGVSERQILEGGKQTSLLEFFG